MSSIAAVEGRRGLVASMRAVSAETVVLGAVFVVAAVIRILTIDNQSIWADEALTAYEAHLPFGAMLNTVAHFETTPPLYFIAVWFWAKLFGTGAIALRSLSSLAGLALVPVTYVCGRELVSRRVGLLAAAFVAVNPLMVWYSQEARSYMLLTLLSALGLVFFTRAERDPSARNVLWWAGLSALAVMTHFFAGFIVAPEALWLLWRVRSRLLAGALVVVALVQGAMLPFAVGDTTHGTGWIHGIPRVLRMSELALEWSVGTLYRRATETEGLIGAAVLIVVVVLLLWFGGDAVVRRRVWLAAGIATFVLLVPLVLGFTGQDYFLSRNEMPAFVPVAIVVATACLLPRTRPLGVALAAVLLGTFSVATARVQTHAYLQRPPWAELARSLGPATVPRAVLASDGTTADPLKLYLPGVAWVQNQAKARLIGEVDVIGVRHKFALQPRIGPHGPILVRGHLPIGWPLPQLVAPRGTILLSRFRVNNWVVGRFLLDHPQRLSILQLISMAPRYFREGRAPHVILVFDQRARQSSG